MAMDGFLSHRCHMLLEIHSLQNNALKFVSFCWFAFEFGVYAIIYGEENHKFN